MNLFNRLPGLECAPAGRERALSPRLPLVAFTGTVVPLLCVLAVRLAAAHASNDAAARVALTLEVALASVTILYWTVVFTGALGSLVVVIAKGPAYVADAYPPPDAGAPPP
jgi:hypothetical protein